MIFKRLSPFNHYCILHDSYRCCVGLLLSFKSRKFKKTKTKTKIKWNYLFTKKKKKQFLGNVMKMKPLFNNNIAIFKNRELC